MSTATLTNSGLLRVYQRRENLLIFVLLSQGHMDFKKFPLAPMGVHAPVSAHAGPSAQPPIGTSGNFPARVSAESISPNFPIFRSK